MVWLIWRLRVRQIAQATQRAVWRSELGERTRIARELHDTLLQSFQGLMLRFQAVYQLAPPAGRSTRRTREQLSIRPRQAITEGRDAVQGLRSSTVETNDLAQAL